jgi:hypothetical protein
VKEIQQISIVSDIVDQIAYAETTYTKGTAVAKPLDTL